MASDSETRSLARLQQFEGGRDGSTAAMPVVPEPPEGSPMRQMLVSIVLPGIAAIKRTPIVGILLFLVGFALPIVFGAWAYSQRGDIVGFALDPQFLTYVVVVGLAAVVARLAAIAEVAHAFRRSPGIGGVTVFATVLALALSAPVLFVAYHANVARGVVSDVFAAGDGESLFVPESGDVDPGAITNVLLLGGDAGPGRWGLRTDTMIIVSVHEATGRTALISIPRNLTRLQFPPGTPMAAQFPNGFDDLANAVFPYVTTHPEMMEYYGADGQLAEAVALSQGIGYSLDVEIDDYALVNMQGFLEVIDAVGGFTLELDTSVPLPPSIPGGKHDIPASIGPGVVEMDGTLAIAYARSRSADSDYQRMGRQRQLLSALGSQVSPADALGGFTSVTGLIGDSMRTSLSSSEFSSLLDLLGDNASIGESVGLVPPLVEPGNPDYDQIRAIVDAVERYVLTGAPSGYAG